MKEFEAAINNTVLKCSSSRDADGRTDGEEEKSVSDGAAAAAEMYISDVQEDDLEIAIKVRSGMNKAVCPDRRPSRHVIFEAKSRTLRLLGRLDPFGNTLLPRGGPGWVRSCLFDSFGPFGDSLTDDVVAALILAVNVNRMPRRAAPLGDICAHPGMMIFSGQPRSAQVFVKYRGRSRKI